MLVLVLVLMTVCWGVLGLVVLMLVGHVGSVALLLLLMLVMNERCGGLCGLGFFFSKPRHVEVFNTTIALLFPALLLLSSGWLYPL